VTIWYVVAGAALGAPARFAIDQYIRKYSTKPYGIALVNIFGSFVIGLSLSATENLYGLFAIGFAGAFTTWSTLILDLYLAFELKRYRDLSVNILLSTSLGLLAAYMGIKITG
jgi:fluoride exporter